MAGDFQIIEHTADVGIVAQGDTLKSAFAAAARGLFSLMADLDEVAEAESRRVEVTAPDQEALLVEWLNELIYLFDVDNLLFKSFDIQTLSPTHLLAQVRGEKVNPARHHLKVGVKATTYHMLKVEKTTGGYRLQVLFDI